MADWKEGLPEDMRGNPGLKDIKDIGGLAKSFLDAQSMIGGSVRLPSKEAGEEGRKAFRGRILEVGKDYGIVPVPEGEEDDTPFFRSLGTPEKPTEYPLPEGVVAEGELAKLLEVSHGAKLTKKQFSKLYEGLDSVTKSQVQAQLAVKEQDDGVLKKAWGAAYDERRAAVGAMLKSQNAPADLIAAFDAGKVNAASTMWLHDTLKAMGGEGTDLGKQGKRTTGGILSPDEALARLDEIDKRIEKTMVGDPEYDVLLQRRVQLIELANPA